jgi:CheY-like chemotaxis protein
MPTGSMTGPLKKRPPDPHRCAEASSYSCQSARELRFRTPAAGSSRNSGIGVFSEPASSSGLLALQLQRVNALGAIMRIRAWSGGRDVKIAVFTAGAVDERRDAVLAAGADHFLCKPFAPKTVFGCIKRLLGVEYVHTSPLAKPVTASGASDLSAVERLPGDLKSRLLHAVLLLDKTRVIEIVRLISAIDTAPGDQPMRHAEALEFSAVLRAVR